MNLKLLLSFSLSLFCSQNHPLLRGVLQLPGGDLHRHHPGHVADSES